MARGSSAGVLWAGVILIAIGAFFLANNFYDISAWRVFARYWPVILILIGLRKLYRYFTWQEIVPPPDAARKE